MALGGRGRHRPRKRPGATSRSRPATARAVAAGRQPNLGGNHLLAGADEPYLGLGAIGPAGQQLGARAAFAHQAGRAFHSPQGSTPSRCCRPPTRSARARACREGSHRASARHRSERAFVQALSILRQQLQQAARRLHLPPLPITSRLGQAIDAPLFRLEILIDMGRHPGGGVIETALRPRHSQHR